MAVGLFKLMYFLNSSESVPVLYCCTRCMARKMGQGLLLEYSIIVERQYVIFVRSFFNTVQ